MNFKIKSSSLQKLGNDVMKGYIKTQKTILALRMSNSQLELLCYSPSTYFQGKVDITDMKNLDNSWKILDGDNFKSFLSILPKDDTIIDFNTTTLGDFTLKYGKNKINLNIIDIGEDNLIKEENNFTEITEVDAVSFMESMKDMSKIVSKDKNKEYSSLSFLHIFFNEDNITLMGTQSISIAENIYKIDKTRIVDDSVLIKGIYIDLLDTTLSATDTWTLIKTKSKFGYKNNKGFIALVAISAEDIKPIKYSHLKNLTATKEENDYNEVKIDSTSLKNAIADVSKLSPTDPSVLFSFNEEGLFIKSSMGDRFEVLSDYSLNKELNFGINKEALKSLYSIWTKNIIMVFKDNPIMTVIEFKLLDNKDDIIDNIFVGVSPDDQ